MDIRLNPCISVVGLRSTATKDDIEMKRLTTDGRYLARRHRSLAFVGIPLSQLLIILMFASMMLGCGTTGKAPAELQELLAVEQPKAGD
jgi:hypothetical protein